jgi:hypothetical protein
MPFPLYITTNFNKLLVTALREEKKEPRVLLCPWYEDAQEPGGLDMIDPDYIPSAERPLVFHMFGLFEELESVVLTEDDYFNFLIGVTRNRNLVPPLVLRALTDRALLFLGFQIDDWNFRVLLRFILSLGGQKRAEYYRTSRPRSSRRKGGSWNRTAPGATWKNTSQRAPGSRPASSGGAPRSSCPN